VCDKGIQNKCPSTHKCNKEVYGVFVCAIMRVCVCVCFCLSLTDAPEPSEMKLITFGPDQ